jgi:hypothetical protein
LVHSEHLRLGLVGIISITLFNQLDRRFTQKQATNDDIILEALILDAA